MAVTPIQPNSPCKKPVSVSENNRYKNSLWNNSIAKKEKIRGQKGVFQVQVGFASRKPGTKQT
jgi:hypothetical protein